MPNTDTVIQVNGHAIPHSQLMDIVSPQGRNVLPREVVERIARFVADGRTGSLQVDFVNGTAAAWKLTETGRIDTRKP